MTADPLFDLTGKRAVVTGGSRGLGREIVRAFAEHGADVAIVSRKLDNCKTLAEEIGAEHGHRTLAIACNVSDWTACDTLADRVLHEWGGIDVLVNNAGMSPLYESVEDITEALWDKVLAVNLKGPFRLATRFGSEMARSGGGSIINVSSLAAVRRPPTSCPTPPPRQG